MNIPLAVFEPGTIATAMGGKLERDTAASILAWPANERQGCGAP
jgi:hypothetical protein